MSSTASEVGSYATGISPRTGISPAIGGWGVASIHKAQAVTSGAQRFVAAADGRINDF